MSSGSSYAARRLQGDRPYQEDDYGFFDETGDDPTQPKRLLAVLADGMGGHAGGAEASAAAVETFIETYSSSSGNPSARLKKSLEMVNQRLSELTEARPELEGMGCTLVGIALTEYGLEWISVGDSPLWIFRDGDLIRLNQDHSMGAVFKEQVRRGEMDADDAANDPNRNALRSVVGGREIALIDESRAPVTISPGDRILVASDGVESLSEEEIARVLSESDDATKLVDRLLSEVEVKRVEGQDNATAMVLSVGGAKHQRNLGRFVFLFFLFLALVAGAFLLGKTGFLDRLSGQPPVQPVPVAPKEPAPLPKKPKVPADIKPETKPEPTSPSAHPPVSTKPSGKNPLPGTPIPMMPGRAVPAPSEEPPAQIPTSPSTPEDLKPDRPSPVSPEPPFMPAPEPAGRPGAKFTPPGSPASEEPVTSPPIGRTKATSPALPGSDDLPLSQIPAEGEKQN